MDATAQGGDAEKNGRPMGSLMELSRPAPWLRPCLRLSHNPATIAACHCESENSRNPIWTRCGGLTRLASMRNWRTREPNWPCICAGRGRLPWWPRTKAARLRATAKGPRRFVGFIVAEARRKSGHIITIDVVAEARRSGVGSALLAAAEEELRRAGAVAVALETPVNNAAAIRFYKQKGYFVEKTVAGYYSNHMDALVMTKELRRSLVR